MIQDTLIAIDKMMIPTQLLISILMDAGYKNYCHKKAKILSRDRKVIAGYHVNEK